MQEQNPLIPMCQAKIYICFPFSFTDNMEQVTQAYIRGTCNQHWFTITACSMSCFSDFCKKKHISQTGISFALAITLTVHAGIAFLTSGVLKTNEFDVWVQFDWCGIFWGYWYIGNIKL